MVKQELIPILIAQNEQKLDELLKLRLLFDCASKNAMASFVLLENKSLSWQSLEKLRSSSPTLPSRGHF